MAWEGSTRRETLPPDWKKRRRRVFARDGYRCTYHDPETGDRCDGPAEECDHVGDRLDHREKMLRSLCGFHHSKRSGAQGGYARAEAVKKNAGRFRRSEDHPGLI